MTWKRRLARVFGWALLAYVGVLLVILSLERKILFHPLPAADGWSQKPDVRIEDVELPLPTGERIHAWYYPREGAKRAVLYSHGNAGNLSGRGKGLAKWSELLDASVLIYDYPGYGLSTGLPDEQNCLASAEAAWQHLTATRGFTDRQVVSLGVSLGGAMAIDIASRHEVEALVAVRTFTSIPDMAQSQFPWLPGRYLVRTRFDSLSKISKVRCPVFVAYAKQDRLIPPVQCERLFEAAPAPKKLFVQDEGGHESGLTPEFFEAMRAFLNEQ